MSCFSRAPNLWNSLNWINHWTLLLLNQTDYFYMQRKTKVPIESSDTPEGRYVSNYLCVTVSEHFMFNKITWCTNAQNYTLLIVVQSEHEASVIKKKKNVNFLKYVENLWEYQWCLLWKINRLVALQVRLWFSFLLTGYWWFIAIVYLLVE